MAEELHGLLGLQERIVKELTEAIDRRTQFMNELAIAKAEVEKNSHKLDLVKQQIMVEKKLIDIR